MANSINTADQTLTRTDLAAPSVALADPRDGLLQVRDLEHPLPVSITLWPAVHEQEICQMHWDGLPVAEPFQLDEHHKENDRLLLLLPVEFLRSEGRHQLQYQVVNTHTGGSVMSAALPIIIDRTAPGGTLLAPALLPQAALDGLIDAQLSEMDDELAAPLPGYFDMQWGDLIQSQWGERTGPSYTIHPDDVGSDRIRLLVDRGFLEQLGDGEHEVTYSVRDRAGNLSPPSLPTTLKLQLGCNVPLLQPVSSQITINVYTNHIHG